MAKKSRRVKKKGQVRLSVTQMVQPGGTEAVSLPGVAPYPGVEKLDLEEEYRHVILDLKRIAILAVAALATLIVLAFLVV